MTYVIYPYMSWWYIPMHMFVPSIISNTNGCFFVSPTNIRIIVMSMIFGFWRYLTISLFDILSFFLLKDTPRGLWWGSKYLADVSILSYLVLSSGVAITLVSSPSTPTAASAASVSEPSVLLSCRVKWVQNYKHVAHLTSYKGIQLNSSFCM